MDDLAKKIAEQDTKLDAIYKSVERTRKYFLWVIIITVAVTLIPAIGLIFVVPKVISTYTTAFEGL